MTTLIVGFVLGVGVGYSLAWLSRVLVERRARKKRFSPMLTIRGTGGWDARWDFADHGEDDR